MNTEELRHFLDSAQTGDGEWRPEPDLDGEGLRRRRDTIWLTDDDGCSLQVDEDDAALMVAALRSNQLQVIERDRLDVERAAIAAAARLEGEVSDLRTQLAACSEAYVQLQVIERDRLDAAWADAEAALPGRYDEPDYEPGEGGPSIRLTLESHAFVGAEHYEAVAFSEGYTVAASASGDTPAAALRNLLSALDSTTGDERG